MNIQVEKIELIRRLTQVNSKKIIDQLKAILIPAQEISSDETTRILSNQALTKKIKASRTEIHEGKGVKIEIKDLWK
jgi:AmiR/NasT family two-component response regulator